MTHTTWLHGKNVDATYICSPLRLPYNGSRVVNDNQKIDELISNEV